MGKFPFNFSYAKFHFKYFRLLGVKNIPMFDEVCNEMDHSIFGDLLRRVRSEQA